MTRTLLIFADDMRADLLRWMPFTRGTLAVEGTTFEHAYCNVPVCQASRVAILTAQYALHSGIYENYQQTEWATGYTDTIGTWAQSGGATTGIFGKVPNGYRRDEPRPGWTAPNWRVFTNQEQENLTYSLSDGIGGTAVLGTPALPTVAALVEDFMVNTVGDVFGWWNPSNPHINISTLTQNPTAAALQQVAMVVWDLDLLTASYLADKPTWIAGSLEKSLAEQSYMRWAIRNQIRECIDLDNAIADLYAALDVAGLLESTNIIFTSDGGVFYGEQRSGNVYTSSKDSPYEPASHIPLIARGPDFPFGHYCVTPVTLQDVSATILELHGGTPPSLTPDGVSLLDAVANPDPDRVILYERSDPVNAGLYQPDGQGVFDSRYKMVRWIDGTGNPPADFATNPDDEYEMYDLDSDPTEKVNVGNDPAYLVRRNALEVELDALL